MKLRWLLTFPLAMLVTWLCWLSNPISCLFPSRQANGRDKLWGIFNLWSTFDNPVDEGYYGNYFYKGTMKIDYDNSKWLRYKFRLLWLSRNTGYGWSYLLFSIPHGTGFQWKGTHWLPFGYHNDFNVGWKSHAGFDRDDIACRVIGLRKQSA